MKSVGRHIARGFVAGLLVCTPILSPAVAQEATLESRVLWHGTSAGFEITWSSGDILARRQGKGGDIVFSALKLARDGFDRFTSIMTEPDSPPPDCVYQRGFSLVSVVGPFLSFRDNYSASCSPEAHPAGASRLTTIDLRKRGVDQFLDEEDLLVEDDGSPRVVHLDRLFGAVDLRREMLRNAILHPVLGSDHLGSLSELVERLDGRESEGDEQCFSIPADLLTRFAFYESKNSRVTIRIGLPGKGTCRENLTSVDLTMRVPPALTAWVTAAARRRAGLLMKDALRLGNKEDTVIRFSLGRGAGDRQD